MPVAAWWICNGCGMGLRSGSGEVEPHVAVCHATLRGAPVGRPRCAGRVLVAGVWEPCEGFAGEGCYPCDRLCGDCCDHGESAFTPLV